MLKYNTSAGSSWIDFPKELNHPQKGLISIQKIDDNECFKWCLFRYLYPVDRLPARIRNIEKLFRDELGFEDIKLLRYFQSKLTLFIKLNKNNSFGICVFGYEN